MAKGTYVPDISATTSDEFVEMIEEMDPADVRDNFFGLFSEALEIEQSEQDDQVVE